MLDTLENLFTSGAYLPFAIVFAYFGLRLVKDETHWLNDGRKAVYAAMGLAALSTLAPIALTGETPTLKAVLEALGAAWALYISPHGTTPTALAAAAATTKPAAVKS